MLKDGERRSIGRSNEVVALVLGQPRHFSKLLACLWHDDPLIRMRAADAAEKVSSIRPGVLKRHKSELLGLLSETTQIELRWHLALMIPRLKLGAREREQASKSLQRYMHDRSSIVKTFAMQALADLAQGDPGLRSQVAELLEGSARSGTPAMKARARKLLKAASHG
jgi:hypothetical protein